MFNSELTSRMIATYEAGDLISICAWCERVTFDGEWLLAPRVGFDAIDALNTLSHSICPGCACGVRKLDPRWSQARKQLVSRRSRVCAPHRLSAAQTDKIRLAGLLAQTILVEKPLQTGHARAMRVTARTSKSSALVAGLIGLIVAMLGVLFLDARARRVANDSVEPN